MEITRDDLYPDIYGLYLYFLDKGFQVGLTKKDFYSIKKLKEDISYRLVIKDNKWTELYYKLDDLLNEIYQSGLLHKYRYDGIEYLRENTYILPLVLTNNEKEDKITMYSDASYYFSCQFHIEKTPSMGVCDDKNFFYCFGCGMSGDALHYLMEYENITFKEAVELLSEIFLIDKKLQTKKASSEALKYRKTILSPEYKELLDRGRERLKRRNQSTIAFQTAEEFYQKRYDTIERIKNDKYDSNLITKEVPKRLYLK